MSHKLFDLNIEKILENWEPHHAVREIIANALDEQLLTQTKNVEIFKADDGWHIRDYGRGLRYTDLTQNENQEKINHKSTIGKFGIGLKDALATFDRKQIPVVIKSQFGDITSVRSSKPGFPDIETLHAKIVDASKPQMVGTEFICSGVEDADIEAAKNLFLMFSNEEVLEETKIGQVIRNSKGVGKIYINGVLVAEEPTFLFSYNITKKTKKIQNSLNRERANVGRSAYSDSIKSMLLETISLAVSEALATDFAGVSVGTAHYEMLNWKDAQLHAIKILNQTNRYIFVTQSQMLNNPSMMDEAVNTGHRLIQITDTVGESIENLTDLAGNAIKGMRQFVTEYNNSYEFEFVDPSHLSAAEINVFRENTRIIRLFGGLPKRVKDIKIASKLRKDLYSSTETLGCWDPATNCIVVRRDQLQSLSRFAGTLLHELVHAKTGADDVTQEFESGLTAALGEISAIALTR